MKDGVVPPVTLKSALPSVVVKEYVWTENAFVSKDLRDLHAAN